ncbi:MAG: arsenate reductase (glutaredoxin) [Proteobacteria bacterium]|nr:MAG: arsenate reductase (glutaredoxin) [Pseudomonadota bacterium]
MLALLGKKPQEIIRFGENVAKEKGLSASDARTEDEWLEMMVDSPMLIARPTVVTAHKAVIGRPPEPILSII